MKYLLIVAVVSVVSLSSWNTNANGLLFYDSEQGEVVTYHVNQGNIEKLTTHSNWSKDWDIVVPFNTDGDQFTDFLFYDRENGMIEIYQSDMNGKLKLLKSTSLWPTDWSMILPGHYYDRRVSELLFYNKENGTSAIYKSDPTGALTKTKTYNGWRTSWNFIVPGNFVHGVGEDLLFYDAKKGEGEVYASSAHGEEFHSTRKHDGWRKEWTQIVSGYFDAGGPPETLIFYDPTRKGGEVEFYKTTPDGKLLIISRLPNIGKSWTKIVAVRGTSGRSDLLFYDGTAGNATVYRRVGHSKGYMIPIKSHTGWRKNWTAILPAHF